MADIEITESDLDSTAVFGLSAQIAKVPARNIPIPTMYFGIFGVGARLAHDWSVRRSIHMAKPILKLASSDDPTPEQIYMARIDQSHREWSGPTGQRWKPYDGPTGKSKSDVDAALASQWRLIADPPLPWWRRVVRKLWRIK